MVKNYYLIGQKSKGLCWYCGCKMVEICLDHVVPKIKGGEDTLENLVFACRKCNSEKGKKTLEEYRSFIERKQSGAPYFNKEQLAWLLEKGFNFFQRLPSHVFFIERNTNDS